MSEPLHSLRPKSPRWTHTAMRVSDIDATIDWYLEFTPLELLERREDDDGYGAWLGHPDSGEFPFILVAAQFFPDSDPFAPTPITGGGPFNHMGIEMPDRDDVDDIARRAEAAGCLAMPATEMPDPVGYICMLRDPDGNMVEFSYDQGVYEKVRELWGGTISPPIRPLPHPPWWRQPGLLRRIFADPQPVLDELRAAHGPVIGLGAGPVRMAIVGDPTALRELFATSTEAFRWGHKFNVLGFVVGEESMIVSDGDDHKRRRSSVQAAFSRRRLNGWIPMIVEQTDLAVDRLLARTEPAREVVDLYPVGRRLVLEIVVRSLFGERLADRAEEIGALFQRPQDYLESPALRQLPHPLPFTRRARVRGDRRALDAIIDAEIARRRELPPPERLDVLDALVGDASLSDGEIRDQVATLIGAGYDTTSATLSWMLLRAASCDGLFAALRDEADRVFGPLGSEPTADEHALRRLEVADRTMRETTRLHPAGVISPREAARDVEVGGYRIPAGTLILWSAYLAGRDHAAWDEPLQFDPDRFTAPSPEREALARAAWVPFGRGARNCIGFALAEMELTIIVARLAQRLDIEPTGAPLPKAVGMVVNRPAGGAVLRVSARGG